MKQLDKDQIIDLFYNKGYTKQAIANELNIAKLTLLRFCERENVILDVRPPKRLGLRRGIKDISNNRYGKLVAIQYSKLDRFGNAVWLCHCDCGKVAEINSASLIRGLTRSCGCEKAKKAFKGHGEISKMFWSSLERNARRRGIDFNITIEEVWNLFLQQNRTCVYTGLELFFVRDMNNVTGKTASLDRIDSSKGYIHGNVQWVHKIVNHMKMDASEEDFINMCKLVAKYRS